MSELGEIIESGFGAVALSFGLLAGVAVYSSGSIDAVPGVLERFAAALWLSVVPPTSAAAWPNAVGLLAGGVVAFELEESLSLRAAGFVAAYASVAVVLHYLTVPA